MRRDNIFKGYSQNQAFLLPPSLEDLIPKGHLVRVVNSIIDKLDISGIVSKYPGGGASAFHPRMMLKVIVYAYLEGVYSSRKIAKALRESVVYMWLAGMQKPDFRTINNFRGKRLKKEIKEIFKQVVIVAMEIGLVEFEKLFIDGTKMEANANKHKMVWRKNVERNKAKLEEKIEEVFEEIERINEEEDKIYGNNDLPEVGEGKSIDSEEYKEKIKEGTEKINKKLSIKKQSLKKKLKELERRKKKYEEADEVMGNRNSYSKTDKDASAMKMKNGEIRPGYNYIIGTENQIIINYEIEQNASDGSCFINFMEGIEELYKRRPEKVHGDGAFGNEENYDYCEGKEIKAYLKYSTFHLERGKKFKENIFKKENFAYDEAEDVYICPNERKLIFNEEKESYTSTGYKQKIKVYVSEDCSGCMYKEECTKGEKRSISINENYDRYKEKARELLYSEEGKQMRKQRGWNVETPFGDIKHNRKFRRFLLRGKVKVKIEAGLLAIGYNIRKIGSYILDKVKKGIPYKVGEEKGIKEFSPIALQWI